LTDFRKIFKYPVPRKSVQRETSCCLRTEMQTDIRTWRS